jgi:hypothetical protein
LLDSKIWLAGQVSEEFIIRNYPAEINRFRRARQFAEKKIFPSLFSIRLKEHVPGWVLLQDVLSGFGLEESVPMSLGLILIAYSVLSSITDSNTTPSPEEIISRVEQNAKKLRVAGEAFDKFAKYLIERGKGLLLTDSFIIMTDADSQARTVPVNDVERNGIMLRDRRKHGIWIDELTGEYFICGDFVRLTPSIRWTLALLLMRHGHVVSYEELFRFVRSRQPTARDLKQNPDDLEFHNTWNGERRVVFKWISELHRQTNRELVGYIQAVPAQGYKLEFDREFLVILRS